MRPGFALSFVAFVAVAAFVLADETVRLSFAAEERILAHLKGIPFVLEVADDALERRRGLSERPSLGTREGILLVFDEPGFHGVWMRGMKFPLDLLWLDEDGILVDFARSVEPETYPAIFRPSRPAAFLIEASAGTLERTKLKIGDRVEF